MRKDIFRVTDLSRCLASFHSTSSNRKTKNPSSLQFQLPLSADTSIPKTKILIQTVMKTKIPYSLILAAASCGLAIGAETAYTTPVGYVSTVMAPGQFTFGGLTVHQPSVAAGVLASSTSGSVTAAGSLNFTTLLTAGSIYILELPDGTIQEISSWSGATLNTPDNVSSFVTNNVTTFKLRPCATVATVFGLSNSSGLTSSATGDPTTVDNVIVYTAPGVSVNIYYFDANSNGIRDLVDGDGWYTAGGDVADNQTIPYPDGFLVQRVAGVSKTLTVSGEVKTEATKSMLGAGFNFLSSVAPAGLTLLQSGLQNFISTSATGDPLTVDNVVLDVAGTQTNTYFFDANQNGTIDAIDGDGWYTAGGDLADAFVLSPGFYISNLGAAKPYKISVPQSYDNL